MPSDKKSSKKPSKKASIKSSRKPSWHGREGGLIDAMTSFFRESAKTSQKRSERAKEDFWSGKGTMKDADRARSDNEFHTGRKQNWERDVVDYMKRGR